MRAAAWLLTVVLFVTGAFWLRAHTPCGFWTFANASDVPARCLKEFR